MDQQPNKEQKPPKKQLNDWVKYTGMAGQMIGIIVVGTFAGVKLDDWLGNKFPLFTLILTLFSIFAAIYLSIKDFLKK